MTLAEAKRNGFVLFAGDSRPQNLRMADYLMYLATNARVKADSWKLEDFMLDGQMMDKAAINKLFFEKSAENRVTTTAATIDATLKTRLDEIGAASRSRLIETLTLNAQSFLTRANEHEAARQTQIMASVNANDQVRQLTARPINLSEQIQALLSEGFYRYHRYSPSSNTLELLTPPIVLTDRRPNLGIDHTVHLGEYRVVINFNDNTLRVHTFADNFISNGYCHPFFNSGSFPCFGNATNTANGYLSLRQYKELLELLQQLLTTYSDENRPYRSLDLFYNDQEIIRGRRAAADAAPAPIHNGGDSADDGEDSPEDFSGEEENSDDDF